MAHLSDLHFGHHDEALTATLSPELLRQQLDLVVISGDFTQRGTEAEFKAARDFVDGLGLPVFSVPGNHDVPQQNLWRRFSDPYGYYRKYIDSNVEPFLELKGVALAGLKTSRRIMPDINWSHGSLARGQLRALQSRFAAASSASVRVIVAHHPLLYPEDIHVKQRTVQRADLALSTFASLDVRLVLSGHFHLSYIRKHEHKGEVGEGAPDGLRRAAGAPILVAQTSSTTSTRLRGHPNAYNLIEILDNEVRIKVRQWQDENWITKEEDAEKTL